MPINTSVLSKSTKLGRVILVRHGESIWNTTDKTRKMETRFTGWCNIPLSERGKEQARAAGRCLLQFHLHTFDTVFTSLLDRSTMTYDLINSSIITEMDNNIHQDEYLRLSHEIARQQHFVHSNQHIIHNSYNNSVKDNPLNPNLNNHHYSSNPIHNQPNPIQNSFNPIHNSQSNHNHHHHGYNSINHNDTNNPNSYENRMFKNPPVINSWRLNERHYGALVGLSKTQAELKMGREAVMGWRRSWDLRPPPMTKHPYYYFLQASAGAADDDNSKPSFDYQSEIWTKAMTITKLPGKERQVTIETDATIPLSESLKDCADRVLPLWEKSIVPRILQGETVLVVAHSNTIRGMVKHIDHLTLSDENLKNVTIPSAIPMIYNFTKDTNTGGVRPIGKCSPSGVRGRFIVNQEVLLLSLAATQHLEMSENLDDTTAFHELLETTLNQLRDKTGGRVEEMIKAGKHVPSSFLDIPEQEHEVEDNYALNNMHNNQQQTVGSSSDSGINSLQQQQQMNASSSSSSGRSSSSSINVKDIVELSEHDREKIIDNYMTNSTADRDMFGITSNPDPNHIDNLVIASLFWCNTSKTDVSSGGSCSTNTTINIPSSNNNDDTASKLLHATEKLSSSSSSPQSISTTHDTIISTDDTTSSSTMDVTDKLMEAHLMEPGWMSFPVSNTSADDNNNNERQD